MKLVVDESVAPGSNAYFGPWMMEKLGGKWFTGRGSVIGLYDTEKKEPVAACLFEGHNGASIMLHVASDGSRKWLNKEYLCFVFHYPFVQLRVSKIISPVEGSNLSCRSFIEHIGFSLEATLEGAAPNGDLLIYTMTQKQCRWLTLRKFNVEAVTATTA